MASEEFHSVVESIRQVMGSLGDQPVHIDIEAMRSTLDMTTSMMPMPETAKVIAVDASGVPSQWVYDPDTSNDFRLLYLHGGAYVAGGFASHGALAARLSKASGCAVLMADYRLAPEHLFPAAVDDAITAFRWMSENSPIGPGPASRTFIAGDSAGGGLTLATLLALRDAGGSLPNAAVTLSAWTDLALTGESLQTQAAVDPMIDPRLMPEAPSLYLGPVDPKTPLASPLYGDPTGLPPLLLQVGDAEVLLSDTTRFAKNAEAAGVDVTLEIWPEMFHVWQIMAPLFPEAQQAIDRIGEFIRLHQ